MNRSMFYNACPNESCSNKKVTERDDGSFFCDKCKQVIEHPKVRYSCTIKIADFSGDIFCQVFGDDPYIPRFMGKGAQAFKDAIEAIPDDDKKMANIKTQIIMPLLNYQYKFRIRASPNEYNGDTRPRFNIMNASNVNYGEMAKVYAAEILKYDSL